MSSSRLLVPVFVPCPATPDAPFGNDYDTPQFRSDVASWLAPLPLDWEWIRVTPDNIRGAVDLAAAAARERAVIVLNFCDGTEDDGYPGVSVVRALESTALAATGADVGFYEVSTSKLAMKRRFAAAGVATSPWVEIRDPSTDIARAAAELGWPLFLKPDTSAASMGISLRSLVREPEEARQQAVALLASIRAGRLSRGEIYAEAFLSGREYTALVQSTGDARDPVRVYPPCERVFNSALPVEERFLSYERYWEQYQEESPPPPGEPYYRHEAVEPEIARKVADEARRAYLAVGGCGYARVDLRERGNSGEMNVLEVNANCGLTSDDQSSAGAILGNAGITLTEFIRCALREAWIRRKTGIPPPL